MIAMQHIDFEKLKRIERYLLSHDIVVQATSYELI